MNKERYGKASDAGFEKLGGTSGNQTSATCSSVIFAGPSPPPVHHSQPHTSTLSQDPGQVVAPVPSGSSTSFNSQTSSPTDLLPSTLSGAQSQESSITPNDAQVSLESFTRDTSVDASVAAEALPHDGVAACW